MTTVVIFSNLGSGRSNISDGLSCRAQSRAPTSMGSLGLTENSCIELGSNCPNINDSLCHSKKR